MEKTATFKSFITALLIGLGGAFAGAFSPVLLVLAAAGVVYVGIRWGKYCAAVPFFFTLMGIFFSRLGSDLIMYTLIGAFTVFALFTYMGFKTGVPYRIIALVLAVFALIALYTAIGLPSLLEGKAPYNGIVESLRAMDEYYRSMGYEIEDFASLRDSVPYTFYGLLIMLAEAAAFLTVKLSHRFLKSEPSIRPMARFREWQLPPSLKIGIPVFAAALILLYAVKFNGASVVLYTVLYMLFPPLIACGIASALYLALRGRDRFSVPITLFLVFLTLMSPYFMALFGAVDLYAGIRRRMIKTDRLIKEAFERASREKSNTVTVDFGDGNGPQIIAVRKHRDAFFDQHIADGETAEDEADEAGKNGAKGEANEPSGALPGEPIDTTDNQNDTDENNNGGDNT